MAEKPKEFVVAIFALSLFILPQQLRAMIFDYSCTAEAVAEVGWHDYYGRYWDAVTDSDEGTNRRCFASAYWDKLQSHDEVGISISAEALTEPNKVILSSTFDGSYRFDVGWDLMDYFAQDANSTIEGRLKVTEFALGAPCRLKVDISFPQFTWTGFWAWQVYIESATDDFLAGLDPRLRGDRLAPAKAGVGPYGSLSGAVDAYAGEEIYVFLNNAGGGYADHKIGDALGYGELTINVALSAVPHLADLNADGRVDFRDFALFSAQWTRQGCQDPATNWCSQADLDQTSQVDCNDLSLFADYWLASPDPEVIRLH